MNYMARALALVSPPVSLTASSTTLSIRSGTAQFTIAGSSGNQNVDTLDAPPASGMRLVFRGTSDTDTVTFRDSQAGTNLSVGGTDRVIGNGDVIEFQRGDDALWHMIHHEDVQHVALSAAVRVPLTAGRNGDYTVMNATGSSTAWKLAGTVGTAANIQTAAVRNTTNTVVGLYEVVLPSSYKAGEDISLVVSAHRVVSAGTTLTTSVDAEAWKLSDAGAAGSDLQSVAAIAFTNTTAADKTFTIAGATLSPGDRLLIRLTGVATEGGNTGTVATVVNSIRLV